MFPLRALAMSEGRCQLEGPWNIPLGVGGAGSVATLTGWVQAWGKGFLAQS